MLPFTAAPPYVFPSSDQTRGHGVGALTLEGGTGMCRGHDPIFSGQSALLSLPIHPQCTIHMPRIFHLKKKSAFSALFWPKFQLLQLLRHKFFQIFVPKTSHFFKENPLPRPYFWKPVWHTPTKKKVECPPSPGHHLQFKQKHCRILPYQHSFFPSVICNWNTLPASVVSAQSLEIFRSRLKPLTLC